MAESDPPILADAPPSPAPGASDPEQSWADMTPEQLKHSELLARFLATLDIQDRRYRLRMYPTCFVANQTVDSILSNRLGGITDRAQAVQFGQKLCDADIIQHVVDPFKKFQDEFLFFRVIEASLPGNHALPVSGGDDMPIRTRTPVSQLLPLGVATLAQQAAQEMPDDAHRRQLLAYVHPDPWPPADDPIQKPAYGRYNMVVLGGGAAGLVTSVIVGSLGGTVTLIEEDYLGGDCLVFGCVPSKALLACAHRLETIRRGESYGIEGAGHVSASFGAVMDRMRRLRAQIAVNDSAARMSSKGVRVVFGRGRFVSPTSVEVVNPDGSVQEVLEFSRCTIATGGRPSIPPISGLDKIPFYTNQTIFNLTELPASLAIIGGGPIGCELGQAFAVFGSRVHMFEHGPRLIGKDEPSAAARVVTSILKSGVNVHANARVRRMVRLDSGLAAITFATEQDGSLTDEETLEFAAVLIATGRHPNLSGLQLDQAGIQVNQRGGLEVNEYLQTTNTRVYVAGDAAGRFQFTHAADHMARIVVRNALFFGRGRLHSLNIPWCTYTYPELAHVGLLPNQIPDVQIIKHEFADVDRAILEGETSGIVQVYVAKGSDTILGATIVAPDAGNIISFYTLAINTHLGLGTLASVIHPYPSISDAFSAVSSAYTRTRLTPTAKKVLARFLQFRR